MNISSNTFSFNPVKSDFRLPLISFKGTDSCNCDVFEKSKDCPKQTTVKDMKDNPIEVIITKQNCKQGRIMAPKDSNPVRFEMNIGNNSFNYYAIAHGKKDEGFYLDELYTDENYARKYKGSGSELLKCVVEESIKRGCNGMVNVGASNFPPPFVFYYKNNFKVISNQSGCNAAIDYAARTNIPVTRLIDASISSLPMELDENGAKDFLQHKKTYEQRMFDVIDKKDIEGKILEADLIEAPDGLDEDYYFQVIDLSKEKNMQRYIASLREEISNEGEKQLVMFSLVDIYCNEKTLEYAEENLQKAARKLGYDKVIIKDYLRRR